MLRHSELKRAASADAREVAAATAAAQRWAEAQQSLQREQAAWEGEGGKASGQLWEHLECEDIWRRRPLLTPNPNGTDHSKASLVQQQSGGSLQQQAVIAAAASDDATLRRVASLARQATPAQPGGGGGGDGEEAEADEESDGEGGGGAVEGEAGEGPEPLPPSRTASLGGAEVDAAEPGGGGWQPDLADDGAQDGAWEEAPLVQEPCELIWRGGAIAGSLRLSRTSLQFEPNPNAAHGALGGGADEGEANAEAQLWPVHELRQMQRRRYLLSHTALELFASQSTVFFNLRERWE